MASYRRSSLELEPVEPEPLLTVVVPTKNERENVPHVVERLEAALPTVPLEIVFVDDSNDGTRGGGRGPGRGEWTRDRPAEADARSSHRRPGGGGGTGPARGPGSMGLRDGRGPSASARAGRGAPRTGGVARPRRWRARTRRVAPSHAPRAPTWGIPQARLERRALPRRSTRSACARSCAFCLSTAGTRLNPTGSSGANGPRRGRARRRGSAPESLSGVERVAVAGQMGLGRGGSQGGLEEAGRVSRTRMVTSRSSRVSSGTSHCPIGSEGCASASPLLATRRLLRLLRLEAHHRWPVGLSDRLRTH